MTKEEILIKIREIICDILDDNSIEITEQTNQNNCDFWDSLFHITFMSSIGNEFQFNMTMNEIIENKSIESIINLIISKNEN